MKKTLLTLSILVSLLLTGCVSGERMVRNSPFDGGKFYRDGINLWPLYYQEGKNQSILFPLIDIDDRGFAVRPFYHKDNDEHGILWPLAAFNSEEGWAGTFYWEKNGDYGLIPLFSKNEKRLWIFPATWYGQNNYGIFPFFIKDDDLLWVFPASWFSKSSRAILPFYCQNNDFLWIGNVLKSYNMFLVFPVFGKGADWIYVLNFIYASDKNKMDKGYIFLPVVWFYNNEKKKEKSLLLLPFGFYRTVPETDSLYSPLFSFRYSNGKLNMLNIALLLYHYSNGDHYVFYPFADADFQKDHQSCWLWPLFNYGKNHDNEAPLFLFEYKKDNRYLPDLCKINMLRPLLFQYKHQAGETELKVLPWGLLWYSDVLSERAEYKVMGGTLWSSKIAGNKYDHRLLGGAVFRSSKDETARRFSLLYKFFSYHRFKTDVKWEFFPFIKILETPQGNSWSFCWRLLEKHEGGGHIFFIPWGKDEKKH